jgi:predicted nucleic acid-binding Zn ribbon protein/G:T-mismatch repair DNA endonuclease (very short patch repair protein)
MVTKKELIIWIKENGYDEIKDKFSPGMELRVNKHSSIKEAIFYYSPDIKNINSISSLICERILYIIYDIDIQKTCPVCKIPIPIKKINCSQKCMFQNKNIILQRQQTCLEKYGTTNPSYSLEIKNKISIANKLNASTALTKRKKTNKLLYGKEFLLQDNVYKNKVKSTTMERYGVDNYFKHPDLIENNKVHRANRTDEEKQILKHNSDIKKFKTNFNNGLYHYKNVVPLFTEDDWNLEITERKYLCLEGNHEFYRYSTNVTRCTICYPVNKSLAESELYNFISSLYSGEILKTDRQTIKPLELDLCIPEKKFAIEYHGLMWHSYGEGESWDKLNNLEKENRDYHLTKTNKCIEKGIQLFHIFENEWEDDVKKEIWKSIIKTKLGLNETIGARECEIKELTNKEKESFLNDNHLQGNINASVTLGLIYNKEIVCVLSMGIPRNNKKYKWEILRFVNKKGISVVKGFVRLLTNFRKTYSGNIITFADKRYSTGNLYIVNKFVEMPDSKPNPWYCLPRKMKLEHRLSYQKHMLSKKLEKFDPALSERENMFNNGWRVIYDCGNKVFVID